MPLSFSACWLSVSGASQTHHLYQLSSRTELPVYASVAGCMQGFRRASLLHPSLEPSAHEGHGAVGTGLEEGHEDDQRAGTPLLMKKGW